MPDYTDADTTAGVTTPSSAEVYTSLDAATITDVTTLSSAEIHAIPDAATIRHTLTVTADERGPFTDLATILTTNEFSGLEKFTHPTGEWGPFDTEDGVIT